jgi:class 3 adenylate cyclase
MGSNQHHSDFGHLLVVDDNKVNRLLLARGLEEQGHHVEFAVDGREALDALRSNHYDLVLLDIMMPEIDGYQVLEELTSDQELNNIPVIMTSAMDEIDSVARCIEMGAEDYLFKPVNPILLKARINASLEKKRLRDQQEELIRKFATSDVAEELMANGFSLGGKYVEATALFADIRSFTAITESQSPADTIELLNTYFTLMFDAVDGQGGIVNQIVGDGIMAVFGAPVPREDHQERAVRAALEMVELVEMFDKEQEAQGKIQIKIGIGIASGQVIAGYTGTVQRVTYTCVGDTVNLASRLEGRTKVVGEPILINEDVHLGLNGNIETVDQGFMRFKGKENEVKVFSVPTSQLQ